MSKRLSKRQLPLGIGHKCIDSTPAKQYRLHSKHDRGLQVGAVRNLYLHITQWGFRPRNRRSPISRELSDAINERLDAGIEPDDRTIVVWLGSLCLKNHSYPYAFGEWNDMLPDASTTERLWREHKHALFAKLEKCK